MNFTKTFFTFLILIFLNSVAFAGERLKDKLEIITGGSRGIGLGIAQIFVSEGAKVLLSRTEKDLVKVVKNITKHRGEASYVVGDITKPEDMKRMVEFTVKKHGIVDILIHNYPAARIDRMSNDEWLEAIKTHLTGAFYAVKAVLSTMEAQKYGRIVFSSSISGPRE